MVWLERTKEILQKAIIFQGNTLSDDWDEGSNSFKWHVPINSLPQNQRKISYHCVVIVLIFILVRINWKRDEYYENRFKKVYFLRSSLIEKLNLSVSLNLYKDVVFPNAFNIRAIDSFELSSSFKSVTLAVTFKLFTVGEENMALSWLLVFFEISIVLEPEVIDIGKVGKVKSPV